MCGISTYKQVKFLGKILQYCCGNSFSFLKLSGREVRGVQGVCPKEDTGYWSISMDMSMDMKKEKITELNHRQKARFNTLLLPLCSLVAAPPVCYTLCE